MRNKNCLDLYLASGARDLTTWPLSFPVGPQFLRSREATVPSVNRCISRNRRFAFQTRERMRLTNRNSESRRLKHRMFAVAAVTTTLTRRRDDYAFRLESREKSLSLSSYLTYECSAESKREIMWRRCVWDVKKFFKVRFRRCSYSRNVRH